MNHFAEKENKNICIIGMGGVGGYFGGKIAYHMGANRNERGSVLFIARGRHLHKIAENGLVVDGSKQHMICRPDNATDDISSVPKPDLCLVCVKGYDLDGAVQSLAPMVSDSTVILPMLNGVSIYERVRKHLSAGIVLPTCVYVVSHIEKPGTVVQRGGNGLILCGPDPKNPSFDHQGLLAFLKRMDITVRWSETPEQEIWKKFVFVAAFGLVTAYADKTLGQVVHDAGLYALVENIMKEIVCLATKKAIQLPEDIISRTMAKAAKLPPDTRSSYQRDVRSKGKKNEGDLFGGTIIRMGRQLGVTTPVTEKIYCALSCR